MTFQIRVLKINCFLLLLCLALSSCQAAPAQVISASRLDDIPRVAVVSAFAPEQSALLRQLKAPQRYELNGRAFTTGELSGKEVVLFLSGVSMVNSAMTIQAALDHFHITAILFSGIAGGANPNLHIGDVVIPAQWAEYQEQVLARQSGEGWDVGLHSRAYGNFGMMFPQPVTVTRAGGQIDAEASKFWFSADPQMLAAAQASGKNVKLKKCTLAAICLQTIPQVVTGGKGISGPSFVDNAEYRQWLWENFQADAVDMESAAAAHVAYTNGVPFLAIRSLSDLAGGGPGQNELVTFLALAADNSAAVVNAFLENWQH